MAPDASVPQECQVRVSYKRSESVSSTSVLQECRVKKDCPTKVSSKSVPQDCQVRVSYKIVKKECPTRVPSRSVLQESQASVSSQSVLERVPSKSVR